MRGLGWFAVIVAAVLFVDHFTHDEPSWEPPPALQTTATPSPDADLQAAIARLGWSKWSWAGARCADGWASPSIGRQGACSWHGGVASVYVNDRQQTILCSSGVPPTPLQAVEQLDQWNRLFCVPYGSD